MAGYLKTNAEYLEQCARIYNTLSTEGWKVRKNCDWYTEKYFSKELAEYHRASGALMRAVSDKIEELRKQL